MTILGSKPCQKSPRFAWLKLFLDLCEPRLWLDVAMYKSHAAIFYSSHNNYTMVSVSLLCKIACIVAFTKVFEAHPVTSSSQQSDSRGDILQSHDDESTTQDHPSIEWRTLTPKANTHPINDNFIKVLADSTSPKHSMRYKTPDICDPTVKQVSCMKLYPKVLLHAHVQ